MKTSETIDLLSSALCTAQKGMHGAVKDSKNPFFKSNYADLESVWTACRKVLTDNFLSVVQGIGEDGGLHTRLIHSSGQWIESTTPIKCKDDGPQALGSAITYARRYALAAIAGVYQTDDDAESAMNRNAPDAPAKSAAKRSEETKLANKYSALLIDAVNVGSEGRCKELMEELKTNDQEFRASVWSLLPSPVKNYLQDLAPKAA